MSPRRPLLLWPLLALLALVGYLAYLVLRPFVVTIIVAAAAALLLAPWHQRLARGLKGRPSAAAALILIVLLLAVVGPLTGYAALLNQQAKGFVEWVKPYLDVSTLQKVLIEELPGRFPAVARLRDRLGIDTEQLAQLGATAAASGGRVLQAMVQTALAGLANAVFQLFLFLVLLFFMLRDGHALGQAMREISPLSGDQEDRVRDHLTRTIRAVLQVTVLVPLAQGLLATIGFLIFGLPSAFFWGTMLVFAAIIPAVGSPLVWLPASVYLYLAVSPGAGVGLLLYSAVLVSSVDNVLKPWLMSGSARIHPALAFIASLGGILAFGVMGFLLGPMVLSLLISGAAIYRDDILRNRGPQPAA